MKTNDVIKFVKSMNKDIPDLELDKIRKRNRKRVEALEEILGIDRHS